MTPRKPRKPRERYNCAKCGRKNVTTFNREIGHFLCDEDLVNYRLWRDSAKPGEILRSFFANREKE